LSEVRRIELVAVPSVRAKYVAGVLTAVIAGLLYVVPNRWQMIPPSYLPLTWIDEAIPFWPATGLVYAAIYFFLVGTFVVLRDLSVVSRFLYACLFTQIVAAACFVLWPTVYPRELYEIPLHASRFDAAIVELVRGMDTPANCLPSLHVSTVVLCAGALLADRRSFAGVLTAVPLALSTLTFKQHYVADVIAGLALGLVAYFVFFRWREFGLRPGAGSYTTHARPEGIRERRGDTGDARGGSRYSGGTATPAPIRDPGE
jgi:membrane-associated phospholipid phosphatase